MNIPFKRFAGRTAKRNVALLVSFAVNEHSFRHKIDIRQLYVTTFTNPSTSRVQQLKQRRIALAEGRIFIIDKKQRF